MIANLNEKKELAVMLRIRTRRLEEASKMVQAKWTDMTTGAREASGSRHGRGGDVSQQPHQAETDGVGGEE